MSPSRTCASCGHVSAGDDRFCPKCGTTLPGLTAAEHAEISQAPTVVVPSDPGLAPRGAPTQPEAPGGGPAAAEAALEEQLRAALSPSFLLVRKLGEGGMASVYLAREPALRRSVAVKVLSPALAADPNARARFEREAQAVAGLSHPNVLAIYGLGELGDGTPYFVMQYVSGRSLAARIEEEGPFDVDEARRITGEVAAALAAAHAKGIVHRDIKPANILYDDESGRALVSDFGIAAVRAERTADGKTSARLTGTGMMVGTPAYMSPEQMLAEPVTEKTDVYALGLLGYELAAGHGPFRANTPQELIAAHLRDVPRPLAELRKDVDPEFAGLVAACLEKDAAKRPTAADLSKRLSPGGGVALEWPPPGLDGLHGLLRQWSTRLWAGNFLLFCVAALGFIAVGAQTQAARASIVTLLLAVVAVLGTVVLVVAFVGMVRPLRRASAAVAQGYTWTTVLEALADHRGDSGALIAGVREYAALEPRIRSALRTARMTREALLFASALLPFVMFLILIRLAAADVIPAGLTPAVLLALPVIALAAAALVDRTEQQTVGPLRAALAKRRQEADLGKLVGPWYASFEAVREGQALGRGRAGGARWGTAGALTLATVGTLLLFALWPLWLFASMGADIFLAVSAPLANTRAKVAIAERTRAYAAAPDPTISARAAGEALYVLTSGWTDGGRTGDTAAGQAPRTLPPLPLPDSGRFPEGGAWLGPDPLRIVGLAMEGFSPEEMAYLERLASHPAWREFETVARAPAMDRFGPVLVVRPAAERGGTDVLEAIPSSIAALKELAYANASRAALLLAQGRRDDAERTLQETVAFGFRLVDDGRTLLDVLTGVVVVGMGRANLLDFYQQVGRPEGVALQALRDSLREGTEFLDASTARPYDTPGIARAGFLAFARDSTWPAGMRVTALYQLGVVPCTNLRELLFGPGRDVDSAFAQARRTLARFAADTTLLAILERQTHAGAPVGLAAGYPTPLSGVRRFQLQAARFIGAALGNPRLGGCAELSLALTASPAR